MTTREVLLHYTVDGTPRRGSGFRIRDRFIVTADHCARGTDHAVWVNGHSSPATVVWRSLDADVDLAVLYADDLTVATPVECLLLDEDEPGVVSDCVAGGFPRWAVHQVSGGPGDGSWSSRAARAARVRGQVSIGDRDPAPADGGAPEPVLRFRGTFPDVVVGRVDDDPAWGGMGGAGVSVQAGGVQALLGVVASWQPTPSSNALTIVAFNTLERLESHHRDAVLDLLGQPSWRRWRRIETAGLKRAISGAIPRRPTVLVRRGVIDQVQTIISAPGEQAVVCPIADARGMGKTQVAAAVARECVREGWPIVWWVPARDPEVMICELAALATALGVAGDAEEPASAVARLRSWFTTFTGRALLVLDDATDPDAVQQVLPPRGCRVIITTVDGAFTALGRPLRLGGYTDDEACSYLIECTGVADRDGAARVAELLGRHPLALAQAASSIRGTSGRPPLSYRDYLHRCEEVPVTKLLRRLPGEDHPDSLGEALQRNLDAALALADDDRALLPLLGSISLLDTAGVDTSWLCQGWIDDLLDEAGRMSVLTWSPDGRSVRMHALMGRFLRETVTPQRLLGWFHGASSIVSSGRDQYDPQGQLSQRRALVERVSAHVDALMRTGGSRAALPHRLWLIWAFTDTAQPGRAIEGAGEAVTEAAALLGPDHPDVLTSRHNLACAYRSAGDLEHAIALFGDTLTDRERVLGRDHPDTLTSRDNLAGAYRAAGQVDQAITLYQETLADRERVLGRNHRRTLTCRDNLAGAHRSAGHFELAVSMFRQTLTDSERVLGPDHPDTLASRNNLAQAYRSAGDLGVAISLFRTTLTESERVLGADHPDTLTTRNNLAGAYQAAGDLDRALALYEATLTDRERVLGPDHPHTLASRSQLAGAYQAAGDPERAIPLFEETLAGCGRALSQGHPLTSSVAANLARARAGAVEWGSHRVPTQRRPHRTTGAGAEPI
ncbi:MAG: tetratricopeptide repeat protein [Actinomycetales bacterium]